MWWDNSCRVRTHEKNSGNCLPIGHNNTKHFLCPIRSRHPLEFLEKIRWELVPRGSFARNWKLSFRLFSQPDWLPLGLWGWLQINNGFFKWPIMVCAQTLVHRWDPEQGFLYYSADRLNPLNPRIKIEILICCPYSFPIEVVGEVGKTLSKFISCDHVLNSHDHSVLQSIDIT